MNNGASPALGKITDMFTFDFISYCLVYLKEICEVVRPEFQSILEELDDIDPHNLIKPDVYFESESAMRSVV